MLPPKGFSCRRKDRLNGIDAPMPYRIGKISQKVGWGAKPTKYLKFITIFSTNRIFKGGLYTRTITNGALLRF